MIYYYFGSKEGLYIAVLEDAYRRMRSIESQLHLEDLPPEEALRRLVGSPSTTTPATSSSSAW
jgi:AcrR family transcriptional regulator